MPQMPVEDTPEEVPKEEEINFGFDVDRDYGRLTKFWKEYKIPGEVLRKGTVAHKRLHDSCASYAYLVRHEGERGRNGLMTEDPEDYFASRTGRIVGRSSDKYRRGLHNEIAIMLYGKPRSGMESNLAEHIMEFALHYIPETTE